MKDYKEELEVLQVRKSRLNGEYYNYDQKIRQVEKELNLLTDAREICNRKYDEVVERIKEVEHILELEEKANGR